MVMAIQSHKEQIMAIKTDNERSIDRMIIQYEEIEQGIKDKPRRDPTIPYWAIWNTRHMLLNLHRQ
ncbi:hypothetical protein Ct9H90mP29_17200 [bacterium]|nr:MAG: hypothetical protein Ct9H90mP29_17200 [bacterium]